MEPLQPGGEWITERWLLDHGFRVLSRGERQPTAHYRRDVGAEVLGGRPFMGASDDLCIEVALATTRPRPSGTVWNCWVVQVEPGRHVHVRRVSCTWELVALYEGLTGRRW